MKSILLPVLTKEKISLLSLAKAADPNQDGETLNLADSLEYNAIILSPYFY
jgi:hypothetical protein